MCESIFGLFLVSYVFDATKVILSSEKAMIFFDN